MKAQLDYTSFIQEARTFIPKERLFVDELRRLAWGTDAGFYRLIPQVVIQSANEEEVSKLLALAHSHKLPVTFRAAGTSLSGQAISDSILIVAGKNWEKYTLSPNHKEITLQPGIIGARVNEILRPYGRKFSPDPASVKSSMVGGIIINNASGMNCGTHANSDQVLRSARIVFADGTILDTGNEESKRAFAQKHANFIQTLIQIRDEVKADEQLANRINYKYSIKNVTGLNIRPFVAYEDPFELLTHLLVGSEGTLAFASEFTVATEYDYPCKASAMLYFKSIKEACRAVVAMKKITNHEGEWLVKGAELLDEKSLSSVNDPTGSGLTAVLTETMAHTKEELKQNIATITQVLQEFETYTPVHFTDDPKEYAPYWAIRAGIFPAVGGTRKLGTTCLIEDIAFHIEDLPEATAQLQELLKKHHYDDACIYGHALEGNFHFIINQAFDSQEEVDRYEALMEDVKKLVVDQYDGSLKAEHGTGRNMAPFVKQEWGEKAYSIMKRVKELFDPHNLLNPGVIFNEDPKCHIKNFKPLPLTHPLVDKCIECGFCEVNCLTCGLTLSSRQRIIIQREISRLEREGDDNERLEKLKKQYRYLGEQSCAGDGLCSTSCPMQINVGELTHVLRELNLPKNSLGYRVGNSISNHFSGAKNAVRATLSLANWGHTLLGTSLMSKVTQGMHRTLNIPQWTPALPKPIYPHKKEEATGNSPRKVVYFPSCINQAMGLEKKSPHELPLINKMASLLHKAGYEIIFPAQMDQLCCGTIWESKGMPEIADKKVKELEEALWKASEEGKYPVLCDQSPCLHRMRSCISRMKLYEPAEFIYTFLKDRLEFKQIDAPIALHITCSMRRMGLANQLIELAKLCSSKVLVPEEVGCCGFAGDKGFTNPEVNAYALRKLKPQIEANKIEMGYSNSRTCEIGLTTHSGIPYASIVYLVDQCTTAKSAKK